MENEKNEKIKELVAQTQKKWGPDGLESGGLEGGSPEAESPKFRACFSVSPARKILFFLLSLVSFSWNCGRVSRPWPTQNAWGHVVSADSTKLVKINPLPLVDLGCGVVFNSMKRAFTWEIVCEATLAVST